MLKLEIPSANGTGTVRGLALLYSLFAGSNETAGISEETLQALYDSVPPPDSGRIDLLFGIPTRFSLGFMKPFETLPFSPSRKAIGHSGLGGSFAFADPEAHIAFAYAPSRLDYYPWNDPRDEELRKALYRCVERISAKE